MKFTPFSFENFPDYDKPIDGAVDVQGDKDNVRIRMVDVPYQEGCNIRFLIPQKQREGEAPWGGPLTPDNREYYDGMPHYPLIVHVQGSGWLPQDMNDHVFDLGNIAMQGYVIAVVQYHGAPDFPFPQQVIDTKRALRYLNAHADELPIDLNRVYLTGDSSGGHTMLLTYLTYGSELLDDPENPERGELPKLTGGIDFYGVTDFNTFFDWWNVADEEEGINLKALLGDAWRDKKVREMASPVHFIKEGLQLPPLLMVHGSKDTVVPFPQSVEFFEKMKKFNYNVQLLRVSGADHGGPIFFCDAVYEQIFHFLKNNC